MSSRRLVLGAVAVVAVALGAMVNAIEDSALEPQGPTSKHADLGTDIALNVLTFQVTGASATALVHDQGVFGGPRELRSDGVWVVVDLSYTTNDEMGAPQTHDIHLRDDQGREFGTSSRARSAELMLTNPGIWASGQLAFEVAPDSLDSLELVLVDDGSSFGPMPTQYAVVPLGLDEAEIEPVIEITGPFLLDEGDR